MNQMQSPNTGVGKKLSGAFLLHISAPTRYEFEGWKFEYDRNKPIAPWPIKKDLEPRKRAGKRFYKMFSKFHELSAVDQDACRI